jgi:hypothetical protein
MTTTTTHTVKSPGGGWVLRAALPNSRQLQYSRKLATNTESTKAAISFTSRLSSCDNTTGVQGINTVENHFAPASSAGVQTTGAPTNMDRSFWQPPRQDEREVKPTTDRPFAPLSKGDHVLDARIRPTTLSSSLTMSFAPRNSSNPPARTQDHPDQQVQHKEAQPQIKTLAIPLSVEAVEEKRSRRRTATIITTTEI